ncbi:hypothetical protein YBT020_24635 [Bacillus thuringiensis serovar finitimus YBT-020]|nr:hypothetical protein YBT020_24635 [Bacillus thuringiensis serovar finitimus YBT-020]
MKKGEKDKNKRGCPKRSLKTNFWRQLLLFFLYMDKNPNHK